MILPEYRTFSLPEPNLKEILRYAGTKTAEGLPMEECLEELKDLTGSVSFAEFQVSRRENSLDFGFCQTQSKDLARNLNGADRVLIFAATVGFLPDRLIAKYSRVAPVKAVLIQAVAAERIETVCDIFCKEREEYYRSRGFRLRPRFSPGYGDLSLGIQKDILTALDGRQRLGITLTESLLMMPSKSVTALVGLIFG